jgi:hypothetical protein
MFSGNSSKIIKDADAMAQLLDRRIEHTEHVTEMLDSFGIGEHIHRKRFS